MRKYRQVLLFPEYDEPTQSPCRGCAAKRYDEGRFYKHIGCCVYCALDPQMMRKGLRVELPEDPVSCKSPPRSKERMAVYADRVKRGLSVFSKADEVFLFDAPTKRRGEEGETGVERCGNRWRARTFWRGKKWLLGTYDLEEEATSRCREWWKIHKGVDVKPPAMWMPCGDNDHAFPIEHEHLRIWASDFPSVDALSHAKAYMMELRRVRRKPPEVDVWNELVKRLEKSHARKIKLTVRVGHNERKYADDVE